MRYALLLLLIGCAACAPQAPQPASPPEPAPEPLPPGPGDEHNSALLLAVDRELPRLIEIYQWFHANPELSLQEEKTAARFAAEVRAAGWDVTERIGGTGVVAVLRNGPGPMLLVRVDMDALPVKEETGLTYTATGEAMHACGHDVHLAAGVGLARVLLELKDRWSGTLLLVGQPAEELGIGSKRILEDPKFQALIAKWGSPSWCLSLHDFNERPAGTVSLCPGWAFANVDTVDITIFGKGGHGARPHQTVDPVVVASEVVLSLQTIVSRRIKPGTPAVVTVGSIRGGTKHNIIPSDVRLQLTVRSFEDTVRGLLLREVRQVTEHVCKAYGTPKPPEVRIDPDWCPASYNDPRLTERMADVFRRLLGADRVTAAEPVTGGEDFGRFARHFKVPGLQYWVGAADPDQLRRGTVPAMHSSKWAPVPEPTLRAAVATLARGTLELLSRR
ncbi:MAG: amidohydrolase [Planctomycetes bacterium]|nr:amidohydrolase [Planctomycetota bacterium]